MGDFVAFRAAIALLKERKQEGLLTELLERCRELERENKLDKENLVRQVYKPFTLDELSQKIAALVTPENFSIPVEVIFQKIETLHRACPENLGDWYFTGNYPTPGGNRVCNRAFINFMEGKDVRGY
jgi:amidophosphoribosyltransferase